MNRQINTYYFFDKGILTPQGMDNARFSVIPAKKDELNNPMFTEGRFETPFLPWENRYDNAYPNVVYDPNTGVYHCYYTLLTRDDDSVDVSREERASRPYRPAAGRRASLCYARSTDGINWEKPKLGFVSYQGSFDNNILLLNAHGTGVFIDHEEQDPRKRFKLVTMVDYPFVPHSHMAVGFSSDGVNFGKLVRWPRFKPPADSHNYPFRDPRDGRFKMITRVWDNGVRVSAVCESDDFINWSAPQEIGRGQGFGDQIYSMPVLPIDGIYLGLASIFHEGDRSLDNFDCVDLELYCGTSVNHFDPVSPGQHLIERGLGKYPNGAFDCGCIYAAMPIKVGEEYCIYYMGGNGQHTNFRETSFGRAFVKPFRWACISPRDPDRGVLVPTTRMTIFGNEIQVLFELNEGGKLECALYDRWNGKPLPGFDYQDATLEAAGEGWHNLRFAKSYEELRVDSVTLMFKARKSKLFALRGDLVVFNPRYYGGIHAT